MAMNTKVTPATEIRQSAANQILEMANKVSSASGDLVNRANNKLELVMSNVEDCKTGCPTNPREPFPPLFEDLWQKLDKIYRDLETIDSFLTRADL